jgi:hypothetical protein
MYLSANRWTSAIWSKHATKQIRRKRIVADWIEEGEIQIQLEGGWQGKKRKRVQVRLTACNPAANYEPFFTACGVPRSVKLGHRLARSTQIER